MSQPTPIGPLVQLLGGNTSDATLVKLIDDGWHSFLVYGREEGHQAGRWCMEHVHYQWTFFIDFGQTTFYVQDGKEAMLFKLTWCLAMKKRLMS